MVKKPELNIGISMDHVVIVEHVMQTIMPYSGVTGH